MVDLVSVLKGLHEAECLFEDRVPSRYRGRALQAVREAITILKEKEKEP